MTILSRRVRALSGASLILASLVFAPAAARTVERQFDAANFPAVPLIDNSYLPMTPDTTQTYRAETPDGCEIDVTTVTGDTRTVDGVTVRVVEDLAYEDEACDGPNPDELVEKTFDWYAQDNSDTVWYMGEDTYDCEGAGSCSPGDGSWEAGVDGADPGIIMLADPRAGDSYYQEFYADHAEDQAAVLRLNETAKLRQDDAVPPGEWGNCLVTKEWSNLELGSVEQKTYCPNIGLVAVSEHHGKVVRFELVQNQAAARAFDFKVPPKS